MIKYQTHLTLKSSNKKVGKIPVSTTTATTCPTSCPFNNARGCYAETGPLALHWRKVTEKKSGASNKVFLEQIKSLPDNQLWRHNQAGDLYGSNEVLDKKACEDLAEANKGKRGFTYTHYKPEIHNNNDIINNMNAKGFTVNLSGNNERHAIELKKKYSAPVVAVVPIEHFANKKTTYKKDGVTFVQCPATRDDITIDCATCKLCAVPSRKSVVCFPAHGTRKNKVNQAVTI
tara:strand:- start:1969 stop:2664 length:696 start_codon:yes stop_codon:yes gene_type:complete